MRRIGRIAVGAEHLVRGIAEAVCAHERTDVLPHGVALRRHLEQAAPLALADQRVAAGEPLRTADVRTEERIGRLAAIFPHRLVGAGIDFDHARKRVGRDVGAVGEQRDVAVGERLAVVLHAEAVVAVFPFELPRRTIDQRDHVEPAEADVDVAVGQGRDRIGVRELVAVLARTLFMGLADTSLM